jgi:hypothetical protein
MGCQARRFLNSIDPVENGRPLEIQSIFSGYLYDVAGDVQDKRKLARAVIEQIRAERAFRGRVDLECVACDQSGAEVAKEAGLTAQEAIKKGLPKPSQCDLVIVILWSRIGTSLPADYTKPDGTAYLSGTE